MAQVNRDGENGESIVITLNEAEASILLAITGRIGGAGVYRDLITELSIGLTTLYVKPDSIVRSRMSGALMLPIVGG